MSSEHVPDAKRRRKALLILALVWVLFGAYLAITAEHEEDLPRASAGALELAGLHLQYEPLNAFGSLSAEWQSCCRPIRTPGLRPSGNREDQSKGGVR